MGGEPMKNKFLWKMCIILSIFLLSGCAVTDSNELYYDNPHSSVALIVLIVTVVLFIIMVYLISSLSFLQKELKYLNNEIARNSGKEREYWIKRKRKLFLSLLPFIKY